MDLYLNYKDKINFEKTRLIFLLPYIKIKQKYVGNKKGSIFADIITASDILRRNNKFLYRVYFPLFYFSMRNKSLGSHSKTLHNFSIVSRYIAEELLSHNRLIVS